MFQIEEELKKLPARPGVYLMHDETDEIIYVGKAINLKNRVRQYFQSSSGKTAKILKMVSKISWFEYIVTDSELEALVLECNLIKEHRPRYNTMLMDDKAYPYIKVTMGEDYPRVLFARQMKKDKSRYFGPYTSAGAVKDTINLIHKLYRIRTCSRALPRDVGKERPCLNYHIHQCDAPCQGFISKEEYGEHVKEALEFLNGKYEKLLCRLESQMKEAAEKLDFENAAQYRELLYSVQKVAQKQKITDSDQEDRDIIALACAGEDAVVEVFFVRGGKLCGRDHFQLAVGEGDDQKQILTGFVKQFYAGTPYIPREIFLQSEIEEREALEQLLEMKRGLKVHIRIPQKGEKAQLVELAKKNAELILFKDREKMRREHERTIGAVDKLSRLLGIPYAKRMEAYDISNISGFQSVGGMVVYEDGRPKRNDYRKFKIRSVKGADDYASLEEVLSRRFEHGYQEREALKEGSSFSSFPDLIMMDGGKGQVHVALKVMEKFHLSIPVCGMVKDENHRTRALYFEEQEISIDTHSEEFRLITRVQDEVHRFSIEYHRKLRSKGQIHSILDDIPGIGPARRKALMRNYSSLEALKEADVEELSQIPQMNQAAARAVYEFFHSEGRLQE